jgi:ABC-type glycerol-3-phosphate transport system substrate-binding protein
MVGRKSFGGSGGLFGAPLSRRSALKRMGAGGVGALAASTGFSRLARSADSPTTNIDVQIFAEPIGDMLAKTAVAMASKSDRYDVIFDDYNYSPQFIAEGALENLEPYLDKDPEFKKRMARPVCKGVCRD